MGFSLANRTFEIGRPFLYVYALLALALSLVLLLQSRLRGPREFLFWLAAYADAARSFRRLSAAEAGRLREKRIDIVAARGSVESMARRMNFDDYRIERFRVLNGLRPGEPLRAGSRVKLVR